MISSVVSLFGKGFIGSKYCEMFPEQVIIQDKYDYCTKTPRLLNFISTVHNYHIFDDPWHDITTNMVVPITILEKARKIYRNNFEFVQISTWFVYGNTDLPAKETSYCNPTGFYGITARAREQLLISYCETFGIKWRILRLANVLGETDTKISAKKNALQFLIKNIIEGNSIKIYYNGRFFRDYIYVDDVCKAINLVINNGELNSIYNIGNGIPLMFADLVWYVMNKVKYDINKVEWTDGTDFHKIVQVKSMFLDNTKLTSLGYKPEYPIYDVLDKLIEHYERNKSK